MEQPHMTVWCALCRSLPENGATDSSALDETTLLHSLRKAGKKAKSAVKRVGLHSAGTSPVKRADNGQTSLLKSAHIPRTPGVTTAVLSCPGHAWVVVHVCVTMSAHHAHPGAIP